MLRGSVTFTDEFERKVLAPVLMPTERGLTASVSHHSRTPSRLLGTGGRTTTAERKIRTFYVVSIILVLMLGVGLSIITARKVEKGKTTIYQRIEVIEPQKTPPAKK
jgi:hypothetical protein